MSVEYFLSLKDYRRSLNHLIFLFLFLGNLSPSLVQAQTGNIHLVAQARPDLPPPENLPRPQLPQPIPPETPKLPPPKDLFRTPNETTPPPETIPSGIQDTIRVDRFEVIGSTVFSSAELAEATQEFTGKPITFAELLRASDAITKLYTDKGYISSGAFIPADQTFKARGGVVKIQVIEGSVESIEVRGLKRLNPDYVRSRIAVATGKPLNVNKLLQALQLLQLNPLIKNISAELAAGSRPGTSVIDIRASENTTFSAQVNFNNNRVPSIGSFQRQIQFNQANLLGLGDGLSVAYANTDGSNDVDFSYTLPVNPYNGTVQFQYNYTTSNVVEEPFDVLDIEGRSQDFAITFRQPILQTPTTEFALGITANRRNSDVSLEPLPGERIPFPSPGSVDGQTRLSVLRFFQDWTQRNSREVFAARSQFSFGIDAFDVTNSGAPPDSRFFSWRGQAQWVRLLAPETLLLLRADAQLADRALVPLEQFGLGGQQTVRGYRQDLLLTDNAVFVSAELRYPILRAPQLGGVLQLTPFIDYGTAYNSSNRADPDPNSLASVGLGLLWQSDRINARFDWGIPLIDDNSRNNTLQENGLYFSLVYTQPF
ncbi:ShlB/FhaC/HecB family hemolysin secretion/activation protein [Nostoc spongiaeforme FACHB-130]|uniref:ShlB/FhaC/HecB family hemolysin secretion/activation protein n=1 Tax=Nostoc spongiaeforme FACHB-130 TaxID=1357510 RepID=A0ABR8FS46_9NOSO|nr:ShlB/FhaC/HecB family hemolysin secretion/activation protein [Nostoc spongiaeforme]MBD2594066.1 ShlB/FhaC/HecB family hemolysin secretion/activation protein [Nostoc spongiaeforme FACHB-130]